MSRPAAARLRERIASSLWLAPGGASLFAILLAKLLAFVDRRMDPSDEAWYLFSAHVDSGRELLATIANALLTFTGVVFSITILVLQLASSQYSPRVLRTFLRNRATRVALAVFVGSFVYAMALLPEVRGSTPDGAAFVPRLALFVAFALVLLSVGVFVSYLHDMAQSIRAVHIVSRVAAETRESIEALFGEPEGQTPAPEPPDPLPVGPSRVLTWPGSAGVLAMVDIEALMDVAGRNDLVIEVLAEPGDFIPRGAPVARVWPGGAEVDGEIESALFVADERTPEQDPAFGFRQLVDIAERALSPGTNDPTTAVQALDQLHDLLRALAGRHFPPERHRDREGNLRLILPRPDWDAYVHLALDEIRQYGRRSLHVMRRMRALIEDLLTVVPPHRRAVLERQLRLLAEARRRGMESPGERALARAADRQDA